MKKKLTPEQIIEMRRASVRESVERHRLRREGKTLPLAAKKNEINRWWQERGF
jgi:hypothetical protein